MKTKNSLKFYNLEKSFFDTQISSSKIKNKYVNYSKYKIKKPWGYEYQLYGNKLVSIWVLCLKKNSQTSMHSHPNKLTYLLPLKDEIHLNTLDKKFLATNNKIFKINKGVYHQSFNKKKYINYIMEFEIPNLKNDILRYHDEYGRENNNFTLENKVNSDIRNKNFIKNNNKKIKLGKRLFYFTNFNSRTYVDKNFNYFLVLKGYIKSKKLILRPGYLGKTHILKNSLMTVNKNTFVVFF